MLRTQNFEISYQLSPAYHYLAPVWEPAFVLLSAIIRIISKGLLPSSNKYPHNLSINFIDFTMKPVTLRGFALCLLLGFKSHWPYSQINRLRAR